MKKLVVVLGITYAAAVALAITCDSLKRKLTLKEMECDVYKAICEGYSSLCKKLVEEKKEVKEEA